MLQRLLGKGVKARRITSLQVRVVCPRLGIFKGVLTLKNNVAGIQLPPSMRKVPPSETPDGDWAWLLIMRSSPSQRNLQISKSVTGGTPCKSFRQPPLSSMLRRLLECLGATPDEVSAYASK